MDKDSVIEFLRKLGVDRLEMQTNRDHWVNCTCPMAAWMHESGQDSRPSFGISINDDGPSVYYCFGCSPEPQLLMKLLHNYHLFGQYPFDAARFYRDAEVHRYDDEDKPIQVPELEFKFQKKNEAIPHEVVEYYPTVEGRSHQFCKEAIAYLEDQRGIPRRSAFKFGIRCNPEARTLIFPLTGLDGQVYLLRERKIDSKDMWTVSPKRAGVPALKFPKLKESGAWFGLHLVDWTKPVLLVETEMDCAYADGLGVTNVVASATSSVARKQMEMIAANAERVIMGMDDDKSGKLAHSRMRRFMGRKVVLTEANWSMIKSPKKPEGCKDLGDIPNRDDLLEVILNAEFAMV